MIYDLILKQISQHIQLKESEIDFFTSLLKYREIKRKKYLLQIDEICKNETFVNKGCLRRYFIDNNGFEHIVTFATETWWTSDLYSFLTQTPATFSIDALEDTEVLQISKLDLEKLYEKVPKFERFFRIMFQNAFVAYQQRMIQSLSFTAEERYLFFINKYPHLEQRISQKQIAYYLGMTPEFLSMIRRKITQKIIS